MVSAGERDASFAGEGLAPSLSDSEHSASSQLMRQPCAKVPSPTTEPASFGLTC
jgi:hypothetical protein